MVCGFIILSHSGIPLIIREIEPGFFLNLGFLEKKSREEEITKKGSLVSSFITALADFSKEIFGGGELDFTIKDIKVHIRRINEFLIAIFYKESRKNYQRVIEALEALLNKLKISVIDLELNWEERYRLMKILDMEVLGKPFPKKPLAGLINLLEGYFKDRKSEFEIPNFGLSEYNLNLLKAMKKGKSLSSLGDILDMFYTERYWDALINLSKYTSKKYKILKDILLVTISLFLRLMHPSVSVPKIEDLKEIIDDIDDEELKKILKYHIKLFDSSGGLKDLISYTSVYMDKLEKTVEKDPFLLHVHELLSFLRLCYGAVPEEKFLKKLHVSHNLIELNDSYLELIRSLTARVMDVELFKQEYDMLLKDVNKKDVNFINLMRFYFHLLKIFRVKGLSLEEKERILDEGNSVLIRVEFNEIINRDDIPNPAKGFFLFAISNLFHVQPDLLKRHSWDKVELYKKVVETCLPWFIGLYYSKRDVKPNLHLYLSSIISVYTTILALEGKTSFLMFEILKNLISDNFEELWYINRKMYIEAYINYLISLGNLAMALGEKELRMKVVSEVASELNKLIDDFLQESDFMSEKAKNHLVRFSQLREIGVEKSQDYDIIP